MRLTDLIARCLAVVFATLALPAGALRAKDDGTVMNGNTRLQVLQERGVDINKLPRERYEGK